MGPRNSVAAEFSNGAGLGIRRTVLHQMLVAHAEHSGVELCWNCPVTGMEDHQVRFGQHRRTARWIVGADGTQSSVRRWAGLDHFRRASMSARLAAPIQLPPALPGCAMV